MLALTCFCLHRPISCDRSHQPNTPAETNHMDIDDFAKQVEPGAKRSRIEPFRTQVFALKEKNYADHQIRDWLEANGLKVSRQAVQQFIKKGNSKPATQQKTTATPIQTQEIKIAERTKPEEIKPQSEIKIEPENLDGLTAKQRREIEANKYIPADGPDSASAATRKLLERKTKS